MVNKEKLEQAANLIIEALDENPNREGLQRTPERVARDWPEMFDGYGKEPESILDKTFDSEGYDELIIREEIKVTSHCEHHILPFRGLAWLGYVPNGRIVGLDKIDKLVNLFAHRLQNQERLTQQIADAFFNIVQPKGTIIVLKCYHDCMILRGVKSEQGITTTSAVRGIFKDIDSIKQEFLKIINKK